MNERRFANNPTIVGMLEANADRYPARIGCTFLADGETDCRELSYAQLDSRARQVAAFLREFAEPGGRVLLAMPSGLEFVTAFFGCLYAGVVAIPFYPPRSPRNHAQLKAIIDQARPEILLVADDPRTRLNLDAGFPGVKTFGVDELLREARPGWRNEAVGPEQLAYLQYTSGSTRLPRGVTVRHDQLLCNLHAIWRAMEQGEESVIVSWLPLFHDMGLVGTVLTPLAFGARTILMSPWHFLQRPFRWLNCMSRHRATSTGAPNFAYDLCVDRISPAQRAQLDLGNWSLAFNGAESVQPGTLERFCAAFAGCGFRRETFYPCYGLAEATLMVSGGQREAAPVIRSFHRDALRDRRVVGCPEDQTAAVRLVGCGTAAGGQSIAIVDPETLAPKGPGELGEIWVAGPGISREYWNDPQESQAAFGARLAGSDRPFLRTGDLGFLLEDELFVSGRLKDVLIVRGQNYSPLDIETEVALCHPLLRKGRAAAFLVPAEVSEHLIIVGEVRGELGKSAPDIFAAIRRVVARGHGIEVHGIALLRKGRMPMTSSGKIQRHVCKSEYLAGTLEAAAQWRTARENGEPNGGTGTRTEPRGASGEADRAALQSWLRQEIAARAGVAFQDIDPAEVLATYGLSSLAVAELACALEERLARKIPPSVIFSHPTLDALSRFLTQGEASESRLETGPPSPRPADWPIAIIGMGCRFPAARNPEGFWRMLRGGRDAIGEVPKERWSIDECHEPSLSEPARRTIHRGGFLDEVDQFDADFFGISHQEAAAMDPQQRLLLEVAYEACEDAGIPLEALKQTATAVFVGISTNDYARRHELKHGVPNVFSTTGNALSIAANRISYCFDLRGPSLAVDTACSSSLAAVHLACRSLRAGESTLAIVGGTNLILSPDITVAFSQAGATSPEGRCKAFDAKANGIVRGEGVGAIILKPLSAALADRDRVYAVIRGTAMNQDGKTNGLTAPNPGAQMAVIRAAYLDAGVAPHTVQYVEAHGTGTALGDPIELEALARVISGPARSEICRVGSVKTNLGHLEAASGIAGVIKAVLALWHGEIPPSLHFQEPNPRIRFEDWKLHVPVQLEPWEPLEEGVRRAAVSAFGFGGTNVHVVLDSFGVQAVAGSTPDGPGRGIHPLVLSAPSRERLRSVAAAFRAHFSSSAPGTRGEAWLMAEDIAFTAGQRRTQHRHRLGLTCRSREELAKKLDAFLGRSGKRTVRTGEAGEAGDSGPVFMFSGQDGLRAPGRALMSEPAFRDQVMACDEWTREVAHWSVASALENAAPGELLDSWGLKRSQLSLFTQQVSLAALWRSWGVEPSAVIGYSIGEAAAAFVAGALDLAQSLTLVHERSRLLQELAESHRNDGVTAALRLSLPEAREQIARSGANVEIVAHNGPFLTVCAGERHSLESFLATLTAAGVIGRLLETPGAGHTSHVEPARERLAVSLAGLKPEATNVPLFSTLTGELCGGRSLDGGYWSRQLREPVAFTEAVNSAIRAGRRLFLEIGPGDSVCAGVAACLLQAKERGLACPSLHEPSSDLEAMADAVISMWVKGCSVDWRALYPRARVVQLPAYPWQRRSYWSTPGPGRRSPEERRPRPLPDRLLGTRFGLACSSPACWHNQLNPKMFSCLEDHVVGGMPLLPATACVEMAFEMAREILAGTDVTLEDLELTQALFVPPEGTRTIQAVCQLVRPGQWQFGIFCSPTGCNDPKAGDWVRIATGSLRVASQCLSDSPLEFAALDPKRTGENVAFDAAQFYQLLQERGVAYGPTFRRVRALWRTSEREVLAKVAGLESVGQPDSSLNVPAVLDACVQPLAMTVADDASSRAQAGRQMPTSVRRVRILGSLVGPLWSLARRRAPRAAQEEGLVGDVVVFNDKGRRVAELEGFEVRPVHPRSESSAASALLEMAWEPSAAPQGHLDPSTPDIPERAAASSSEEPFLILSDRGGLARLLVERLRNAGRKCVLLGEEKNDSIEPTPPSSSLRSALAREGKPCRIVDLRALDADDAERDPLLDRGKSLLAVTAPILDLARLIASRDGHGSRLRLVTRGAMAVEKGEGVGLAQHCLWGLALSLAAEQKRHWDGIVDLDSNASEAEAAESLVHELLTVWGEDQSAWRSGRRYVPRLNPASSPPAAPTAFDFRADATYLVTGGFGGLGLVVAEWLVARGARRLLLVGRKGLPDRTNWPLLAKGSPEKQRVEAVRRLEALGAAIHVASVDVADRSALGQVLDGFRREQWPEIRGVFHLAGVVEGGLLTQLGPETLAAHFGPKAVGAWNLHCHFQDAELDHFVLFSSGSSILPSPGLGPYAAANAFLNGLALQRRHLGSPALSISWGYWQETGMAAEGLAGASRQAPQGMRGLSNQEGLRLLEQLLPYPGGHIAALPFDWPEWAKAHPQTANSPYLERLFPGRGRSDAPDGLTGEKLALSAPGARLGLLEAYLQRRLARSLGVDPEALGTETPLSRLGVDSLMGVELNNRIEEDLNVALPLVALLQGPTISSLAEAILERITSPQANPPTTDIATASEPDLSPERAGLLLRQLETMPEQALDSLLDTVRARERNGQ